MCQNQVDMEHIVKYGGYMQYESLEIDMYSKGVDPGRDAVDLGCINSVMKGWGINPDSELARGA